MRTLLRFLCLVTVAVPVAARLTAQTTPELRTSQAYDAARSAGPPALYAFLKPMPKGADLHMHLSGAVYAETFLADAVAQGLCIEPATLSLKDAATPCPAGQLPAATVLTDQHLYDELVDAFSMRAFVPTPGTNGHDQFFATFGHFNGAWNPGEWLDEVASRAASQNEQYLEIMNTPPMPNTSDMFKNGTLPFPTGVTDANYMQLFGTLRATLLASPVAKDVPIGIKALADQRTRQRKAERCDELPPDPPVNTHLPATHAPACAVTIHWLYQVLRAFPPQRVFAQTLLAFESASKDAQDIVGLNFVQPEDARIAMADYHLQMLMLDYFHSVYPAVRISLHAGELAPGFVPPDGLTFHIREAVALGHATRIGHGVDVLYEDNPAELLRQLAARHIMVEINLTSNDGILGIKGVDSPVAAYRAAHVPIALSTDDEGVNRSDLSHEYSRAAYEQGFTYADAKRSARTSLEHAFLSGPSLWSSPDDFTRAILPCSGPVTPTSQPSPSCASFLATSERATMQYELERRFALFELSH